MWFPREGLRAATDDPAQTLLIHFDHGGGNRQLRVTTVQFETETLGRWIRAAVDRALDEAETTRKTV